MDEKVSQSLAAMEHFIQLYRVSDKWIDTIALFGRTRGHGDGTMFMSKKMGEFYPKYEDECHAADEALDVAMKYLYKERRKPKAKVDEESVKRVGTACYKTLTIFGVGKYSPKRLFQYALAHYLAMKKKHWTKNGGEYPCKLKYGGVRWEIADLLHPRASLGGKIATQTRKMKVALYTCRKLDNFQRAYDVICDLEHEDEILDSNAEGSQKSEEDKNLRYRVDYEELEKRITDILKQIDDYEGVESLGDWEEQFLIIMETNLKKIGLGYISHTKHELLIDTDHPDYPASITDEDTVIRLLYKAVMQAQQELKLRKNLEIMPEVTNLSDTRKKVSFRLVADDIDREIYRAMKAFKE